MVFISFRHESDEHRAKVRALADRLIGDGIEVVMDALFLESNPGGPNEGWPQWCEENVSKAEKVVIVPTQGWVASYKKQPLVSGPGAACEAHVIRQELYDKRYVNTKFRLISFGTLEIEMVPKDLKGYHAYQADDEGSYQLLVRWLEKKEETADDSESAWLDSPPDLTWPFADNYALRDAFATMLTKDSPNRVLLIEGMSERGKSSATEHLMACACRYGWLGCGRLDLKGGGLAHKQFDSFLVHLPVTAIEGSDDGLARLKQVFHKLEEKAQPTLVIFDTYESVRGGDIGDWLKNVLLLSSARAEWLRVVIAGQKIPQRSGFQPWEPRTHSILLDQPTCDDWMKFAGERAPTKKFVRQAYDLANGSPSILSQLLGPQKSTN
jgi:hypothetical protein